MMLSDRHPILLANARIIDPSRDLDIVGDLLIAEGVIREAKKGIGAAGVPEGTDVIDCRGKVIAPGLIDMRAFIGEPGEASRETSALRARRQPPAASPPLFASPTHRLPSTIPRPSISSCAVRATTQSCMCIRWPRSPRGWKAKR